MTEKHSQNILRALEELESRQEKLIELFKEMSDAYGGATYSADLVAIGAIKRTISTATGFRILVESWNLICARALLRMQIDTALRFYALFLVDSPHEFALDLLGGKQINHMKDSSGNKMTDAYLVSKLAAEYPWLPDVYNNLSGYVHFSNQHLFSPVERVDSESRTIEYIVSEKDTKFPEFSWLEVVDCFNESVDIFAKDLEGWIFTRANPEIVAKLKEKLKEAKG